MSMETEAKLRVDSFEPVRARLGALGALGHGSVLERNWVLDAAEGGLLSGGMLLRLRNTGGAGGVVTVKGKSKKNADFKSREEVETSTDNCEKSLRQFAMLGYSIAWRYEKIRESWRTEECSIELDHCPEIGNFVEIEGTPDAIRALAPQLGLDADAHVRESYLGLWQKHLQALGQAKRDMVFSGTELRSLGIVERQHDTD